MKGFIPWKGGPCPVNRDSLVRVQIRARLRSDAEKQAPSPAKNWRWDHRNECGDIVAFEQTGELA
jgi:hypothetical protein